MAIAGISRHKDDEYLSGVENEVSLSVFTPPRQARDVVPKFVSIAQDGPTFNPTSRNVSFSLGH